MTDLFRLTVNLVPKAAAALASASEREHVPRTDIVNRALRLYDEVSAAMERGCKVGIACPDGTAEKLVIL